jgi:hypothetical protein
MLKKITVCSICGSQTPRCDGNEWEIVPNDPEFLAYSNLAGAQKRKTWKICTSRLNQNTQVPEFTIVVGHGVNFIVKVRRKSKGKKK